MESPLRLTAHGGFGEGDGETRLSKGRKVRPVPTLRSGGEGGDSLADHDLGGLSARRRDIETKPSQPSVRRSQTPIVSNYLP
jgi:hypothetical protein